MTHHDTNEHSITCHFSAELSKYRDSDLKNTVWSASIICCYYLDSIVASIPSETLFENTHQGFILVHLSDMCPVHFYSYGLCKLLPTWLYLISLFLYLFWLKLIPSQWWLTLCCTRRSTSSPADRKSSTAALWDRFSNRLPFICKERFRIFTKTFIMKKQPHLANRTKNKNKKVTY